TLRLRVGLTYASVPVDTTNSNEDDWRLPYSAQLWRDGEQWMTGLSIVGRPALADSAPDVGRSTHRAIFSLMLDGDRVQPGLLVGAGLDPLVNDGELVPVGGVTLSISYKR
ncbi:MAG: hypothetical protein BRD26_10135, partial [Bacteroidetes bacterium QH_1_64_81]